MPRRARIQKRTILPDPIYGNPGLAKFINCVMLAGKKSTAEKIVYDAFEKIRRSQRRESNRFRLRSIRSQVGGCKSVGVGF